MRVVVVGALNGAFAVAFGAIGAHVLEGRLTLADSETFQTAVFYQAVHAAVLVAMGPLKGHVVPALLGAASWTLALGVILFSGSLYALALNGPDLTAGLAPVGGALMIIGWLLLAVAAARRI